MKPHKSAEIIETPTSTSWFDEEGILCAISKKGIQPTLEERKKRTEEFKKALDGKKICMLVDITNASESSKEAKDYLAEELPKIVKAMAFISKSPLGTMLANLYLGLKPTPFPSKIFSNEADARKWLKDYLI